MPGSFGLGSPGSGQEALRRPPLTAIGAAPSSYFDYRPSPGDVTFHQGICSQLTFDPWTAFPGPHPLMWPGGWRLCFPQHNTASASSPWTPFPRTTAEGPPPPPTARVQIPVSVHRLHSAKRFLPQSVPLSPQPRGRRAQGHLSDSPGESGSLCFLYQKAATFPSRKDWTSSNSVLLSSFQNIFNLCPMKNILE